MHVCMELKRHAGELPVALSSQASKLCQLTRSLREAPDLAGHYYARACALLTMKMYSEAAHDADACLRLQPSFAKARFAKGRALYFLGEYESAFAQCVPPSRRELERRQHAAHIALAVKSAAHPF